MIHYFKNKKAIKDFKNKKYQVGILSRPVPNESKLFFSKLCSIPFSISGFVNEINTKKDIHELIKNMLRQKIKFCSFYDKWLNDMSQICKIFCSFQEKDKISFWLGSERGCKRFHVDMVPYRCLVTYSGQGTELLPDKAADRNAFVDGKSNENIIKNRSAIKYLNRWDVAIFRGGNNGILHRTPESALNDRSSILMRLDDSTFLEQIEKINTLN